MKPFIESEIERLETALNALKTMKSKLSALRELPETFGITFVKLNRQIQRAYHEYENTKVEILKGWATEEVSEISY
jgi:hypothetical protein